jgi:hypothetical protein
MDRYHFVSLFLTLAITVDLQEVVSPSHVYTELVFCRVSISDVFCMVTIMWNTLNEWFFCVCGINFDFIQGVLFLLFYFMGLTDESVEIKGHDSFWCKYWLWIGCHAEGDKWMTYCRFKPYTTFLKLICSVTFRVKSFRIYSACCQ